MATEIWVNTGSGDGLLPYGTKPSPEPMLTNHQSVKRQSPESNFTTDAYVINDENYLENYSSKILFKSNRRKWVN